MPINRSKGVDREASKERRGRVTREEEPGVRSGERKRRGGGSRKGGSWKDGGREGRGKGSKGKTRVGGGGRGMRTEGRRGAELWRVGDDGK